MIANPITPIGAIMPTKDVININLRLPAKLHKKLVLKARRDQRSLNSEMLWILQQAVADITDDEVTDEDQN